MRFGLASANGVLQVLTLPLLALPGLMFVFASWIPSQTDLLGVLGCLLVISYITVWLFLRPGHLEVTATHLVVDFPLRALEVPRDAIRDVVLYEGTSFAEAHGGTWFLSVSGLWGGAGWLHLRGCPFEAYAARPTDLVVIYREADSPLLLSPDNPAAFVRALAVVKPALRAQSG